MLLKKLALVFLMGFVCLFSNALKAQQDATISPDEIQYWVGDGDNEVVLVVNFGDPDVALAWGYRFSNDSITVHEVLESVVNEDPRLDYACQYSYVEDIWYVDEEVELYNSGMGWLYNVNGVVPSLDVDSKYVKDGEYVKFGDFAIGVDVGDFNFVWPTEVEPVTDPNPAPPTPEDATIAFEDIVYWIGEGNNEVVLVVNFGDPDVALAWGYRFSNDSITVHEVLESVVNEDPRLDYACQYSYVEDIWYVDEEVELYNSGMGWLYNVNGVVPSLDVDSKYVKDGEYVKFGDFAIGVDVGDFNFVWPTEVEPVTEPVVTPPTPEDATIAFEDIVYWIGEGNNEVVLVVNFGDPDVALAWGYRFSNDSITVHEVLESVVNEDPRLDYACQYSYVEDIWYVDEEVELYNSGMGWLYNVNGVVPSLDVDSKYVKDGEYVKFGDFAIGVDVGDFNFVWPTEVEPVTEPVVTPPTPEDATIAFEDIVYWIGEGNNEVALIVNWNEPDTAFAWGYRFNGNSVVVREVMDAVAAADARFSYELIGGFVDDIMYNDGTLDLSLSDNQYWMYNVNGIMAQTVMDAQLVVDGDYIKWGDTGCGTDLGDWNYVWTKEVTPVSVYLNTTENHNHISGIYPNPATTYSRITLCGDNESLALTICDVQGRVVCRETVFVNGQEEIMIDIHDYNRGVYYVNVKGDGRCQTNKLIVK